MFFLFIPQAANFRSWNRFLEQSSKTKNFSGQGIEHGSSMVEWLTVISCQNMSYTLVLRDIRL